MARVATNYTIDELISVCIARQVSDGDVLAQGLATPLAMAGYLLAQYTHAPHVCETEPPTVEQVQYLRKVIDPLGIRRLETSGAAWKRLLREILAGEGLPVSQDLAQPDVVGCKGCTHSAFRIPHSAFLRVRAIRHHLNRRVNDGT